MPKFSPKPDGGAAKRTATAPQSIARPYGMLVAGGIAVISLFTMALYWRPWDGPTATSNTHSPSQQTDAKQQFAAIADRYRKAKSYSERATFRLRLPSEGGMVEQVTNAKLVIAHPNQVAVDVSRDEQGVTIRSDGKQIISTVTDPASHDFDNQYVQQTAPERLTAANLYSSVEYTDVTRPNQLLSLLMDFPLDLQITPFGIVMSDESWQQMVTNAKGITKLEDQRIETETCQAWRVSTLAGDFTFFVAADTGLIRRIEYPVARLLPPDAPVELRTQASLVSDHHDALIDGVLPHDAFAVAVPTSGKKMRHFVLPFSEVAPKALKLQPGELTFNGLDEDKIASTTWQGKIAVLVWFNDHPASQAVVTQIDRVRGQLAKDLPVTFLAICTDPPTEKSDRDVAEVGRRWRISMPIARDVEAIGRDVFFIEQAPTLVVIDKAGVVQLSEVGANPDLERQLPIVLEKLLAGDDIAAEFVAYIDQQRQTHAMLMASASWETPSTDIQLAEPVIAPRSEPELFQLERAWRQRDVEQAGNILVVDDESGNPTFVVNSGWTNLAILDPAGQIIKSVSLTTDRDTVVSRLRTAVDGKSKRYFAGTSALGKSVYLFDDQFQHVLSYPAADQNHAGIHDFWLSDANQDGALELYVGFAGVVGLHAVAMDGQRIWANRNLAPILSLTEVTSDQSRMLLATSDSGQIDRVDVEGRRQTPVEVRDRVIHHVFASRAKETRPTQLCGLSTLPSGQMVAIGLTPAATEAWSYPLPRGISPSQVQPVVSGQVFGDDSWDWLFVAPDGSLHVVADDGRKHDRFHYGRQIDGLATARVNGRTLLIVSTDEGVDGWWINPKP